MFQFFKELFNYMSLADKGAYASIFGLIIGIAGLFYMIYQIRKTKSAAQSARRAADEAKSAIYSKVAIDHIAKVINTIDNIIGLQKDENWDYLYAELGTSLDIIQEIIFYYSQINSEDRALLEKGIKKISGLHKIVGNTRFEPSIVPDKCLADDEVLDFRSDLLSLKTRIKYPDAA